MTKGFGIEDENNIKRPLSKGLHSGLDANNLGHLFLHNIVTIND